MSVSRTLSQIVGYSKLFATEDSNKDDDEDGRCCLLCVTEPLVLGVSPYPVVDNEVPRTPGRSPLRVPGVPM